jgi:hypothetical protein
LSGSGTGGICHDGIVAASAGEREGCVAPATAWGSRGRRKCGAARVRRARLRHTEPDSVSPRRDEVRERDPRVDSRIGIRANN